MKKKKLSKIRSCKEYHKKFKLEDFDEELLIKSERKRKDVTEPVFRCKKCKAMVTPPSTGGLHRNHCPYCLHSLHVDSSVGDRQSECGSLMEPISIWVRNDEWVLIHRCKGCGAIRSNRIAMDDNEILLLSIAARPLGRPAFPLDVDCEKIEHPFS